MKVTDTSRETDTYNSPEFWSEEWIQEAIKELDLSNMTPMEREYAERQIVKAVMYNTSMKEREDAIRERDEERQEKEKLQQQRTESVIKLLVRKTPPYEVADILSISLEEVLKIKQTLEEK